MLLKRNNLWAIAFMAAVVALACMLCLYENASAQQQRGNPQPFSNSVEQREEMVRELKEIKALLREQNSLLRTLVSHATQSEGRSSPAPAASIR